MTLESNYGSSEYSAQAEELFARYLLDLRAGTAVDFEEFCAAHGEFADELYGLHADWDNVRGLMRRLEVERPAVREATTAPVPELPELAQAEPPVGPWRAISAVALVAALAFGTWSWNLRRDTEVLAAQKQELNEQGLKVLAELGATRQSEERLALAKSELETTLDSTARQRDEARGRGEELSRDLASEREAKLLLGQEGARLAAELEAQRRRQDEAAQRLVLTEARAKALAGRLQAEELVRRERDLWPNSPAHIPDLRAWLDEARTLLAEVDAPLDALRGEGGLVARTAGRLERLEAWERALAGEHGELWRQALERIADPTASPRYVGAAWEPQCGLVPLGVDPGSGLLRFADSQSGELPESTGAGELVLDESSALIFVLVPGLELEESRVPAFLVTLNEWTAAHRERIFGQPNTPGAEDQERLRYELDLRRLGFEPLSALRSELARQAGLHVTGWRRHPTRPLLPAVCPD
jgi:hypothetical protein